LGLYRVQRLQPFKVIVFCIMPCPWLDKTEPLCSQLPRTEGIKKFKDVGSTSGTYSVGQRRPQQANALKTVPSLGIAVSCVGTCAALKSKQKRIQLVTMRLQQIAKLK
uniref:Uncharacterized protein n=1 Tax=Sus scrofa TaxID=9823 RepID=A0A8D1UUL5_PIG